MNNYLMFHRLLKCQLLPTEKIHPEMFKGATRKFKKPKAHAIAIQRHNKINKDRTSEEALKRVKQKKSKSLSKLAEMGIDFEYPGLVKIVGKEVLSPTLGKSEVEKTTLETQTALAEEAMRVLHGVDDGSSDSEHDHSDSNAKSVKETIPTKKPIKQTISK